VKVKNIDMETLQKHILEIRETGGTNMEAGMREGLSLFDDDTSQDSAYQNRLVFITDAMPNI
jgi:Mg-chelatase subunit ChlD